MSNRSQWPTYGMKHHITKCFHTQDLVNFCQCMRDLRGFFYNVDQRYNIGHSNQLMVCDASDQLMWYTVSTNCTHTPNLISIGQTVQEMQLWENLYRWMDKGTWETNGQTERVITLGPKSIFFFLFLHKKIMLWVVIKSASLRSF